MRVLLGSLFAATILSACAVPPVQTAALPDNRSPSERLAALCESGVLPPADKAVCEKNLREATPAEMPIVVMMTEERVAALTGHKRRRGQGWESMTTFGNNNNYGYNGYTSRGAYEQSVSPPPQGLVGQR